MPGARRINNGVDAIAMLHAMNAGIVGILGAGVGVIVDGQAFEPVANTDLEDRLQDLRARGPARVAFIELSATDEPLADRQRRQPRHAVRAVDDAPHTLRTFLDNTRRRADQLAPERRAVLTGLGMRR